MLFTNRIFEAEIQKSIEELADSVTGREIRIMKEIEKDFASASTKFNSHEISSAFVKSIAFDLVIGDRETLIEGGQEFVHTLEMLAGGQYPPQFKRDRQDETYLSVQCQKILNWMEEHWMIQVA